MAYNMDLARRIREELLGVSQVDEKKMFGGVGFMVQGNLACGVNKDDLIVRVGPKNHARALAQPHTRPFDLTGKPMAGWVSVERDGYASDEDLRDWVRQGVEFARSLPAK